MVESNLSAQLPAFPSMGFPGVQVTDNARGGPSGQLGYMFSITPNTNTCPLERDSMNVTIDDFFRTHSQPGTESSLGTISEVVTNQLNIINLSDYILSPEETQLL